MSIERLVADLSTRLLSHYGDDWDVPASLFHITGADFEEYADLVRTDTDFDSMLVGLRVTEAAAIEGHPAEALIGATLPADALGCALVAEGWSYPPGIDLTDPALPLPSEHPDRVESRTCILMLRDGTTAQATHLRGDPEGSLQVMSAGGSVRTSGRLIHTLRRVCGLASGIEPAYTVAEVVSVAWTVAILTGAEVVTEAAAEDAPGTSLLSQVPYEDIVTYLASASPHLVLGRVAWPMGAIVAAFADHKPRDWDEALEVARRSSGSWGGPPTDDPDIERRGRWWQRFLWWADGPMVGARLAEELPPEQLVGRMIEEQVATGRLSAGAAEAVTQRARRLGA